MANREQRARIAAETVAITQAGTYVAPSGRTVSIQEAGQAAVKASRLFAPADSLRAPADGVMSGRSFQTVFDVRNETTFAAARRLTEQIGPTAVLNFASAKSPGGGFLSGSQAQEESLARASALHACLERHAEYYEANRRFPSALYTDHLIVSAGVPVFRDDEDRLLEEPWKVTIITSPAPNAGAIAKNEPEAVNKIVLTFRRRIEQVLSAAVVFDQVAIVLGAWGCGVFGNDPRTVAMLFGEFLLEGPFARAFQCVSFAVRPEGQYVRGFR